MNSIESSHDNAVLCRGIFWIIDTDDISSNISSCFLIPCDPDGNIENPEDMTAKSGLNHNHERFWEGLPKEITHGKPFNYYPRGRVEIAKRRAVIYLNPNIDTEEVHELVKNQYGLTPENGIGKIRFVADGSDHYRCYLDE